MKRSSLVTAAVTVGITLGIAMSRTGGTAHAQQWPTSDPSYNAANPLLAPPEGFGAPGQIVVSSDFDLELEYSNPSGAPKGETKIQVAPALAFFLLHNLAVGGFLDLTHKLEDDGSSTTLGVGPLVGYNIPVGARLSLFPTAGVGYTWAKTRTDLPGGTRSSTYDAFRLIVRAPLLFHPFPHVFVGLAPYLQWGLTAKSEGTDQPKARAFGVTLDLGFWL
jgi:hypothetical protein